MWFKPPNERQFEHLKQTKVMPVTKSSKKASHLYFCPLERLETVGIIADIKGIL